MKIQLANEFYFYLVLMLLFTFNTAFSSYRLFSKKHANDRNKFCSEGDWQFYRTVLWFDFIGSLIVALILFFVTVNAHSAWISYVEPWKRGLTK